MRLIHSTRENCRTCRTTNPLISRIRLHKIRQDRATSRGAFPLSINSCPCRRPPVCPVSDFVESLGAFE
jgi:hypothetical protein